MRAIRVHVHGGPEALRLDELDTPEPGPGQVRVRVHHAGVNFIDVYQRTGLYPIPAPVPLGLEGAGVVEALGAGVTGIAVGARVAWSGVPGSYATHVLAPADRVVPVPDDLDTRTAAALMLQGMTAHYLVRSTFPLATGHAALIHAAAGGTGLLVAQLARRAGATAIGTVSTAAKAERALAAGCSHVIRYTEEPFAPKARSLTGGRGVDVVYDSVGRTTFEGSLDALRVRGTLVLFGQSSGSVPPVDLQVLNTKGSLFVTRPTLFHHIATREDLLWRASEVMELAATGALAIAIDRVLPLADAAAAHHLLESRATSGKLVLDTAD
jgi:NADPH2:quinone reductase